MAQQSNLARHRAEREGRSSNRRSEIIDAAEALFLERGIAATTMTDIAERVGVTRVTLYRYFADRDTLAFEVAARMLDRLVNKAREALPAGAGPVEAARAGLGSLIVNFEYNRDVHWYLTVLDSHRPFRDINEELAQWYASRRRQALLFDEIVTSYIFDVETAERLVSLANIVMGVLGRFAIKGEEISRGGITLETQLGYFREVVFSYFDTVLAPQAEAPARHPGS